MKTKSFHLSLFFAASAFAFLSGCSGSSQDSASESHDHHADEHPAATEPLEASKPTFEVDQKFQDQLSRVFASYVDLKEAFVSSNVQSVQQQAAETKDALAKVDMKLLAGAAHNDWMNFAAPMEKAISAIQSGTEIDAQRESFSILSDNLYKSTKAFGLGGDVAYYTYCPMAFDNEGAYWLSDNQEVRNPYFGDKMLTCGQVKEALR